LILYGGFGTKASVYTFNTQSNLWSVLKTVDDSVTRKRFLTGIFDYNGKMYLFGGTLVGNDTYSYDMPILDTINLNWGKGSLANAPTPIEGYGATLLSNQHIIYLGK